jgi:TonB family protein
MKAFLIVLTIFGLGSSVYAQDGELATARDLYASAAYEDALTLLNRLRGTEHPANQSRAIEQYRAFCLLALGRASDAERAIEAVVAAEPTYHPSDSDVSPRVRSAFTDVRRRMLPGIIQQKYTESKAAFDRKEWSAAASGFSQVLNALADPDVAAEARQSPLSDLRTLAVGFEELSAKAAAPPPPPPPAPVAVAAVPTRPAPPRIYTLDDAGVQAPVIVHQVLPQFPGQVVIPRTGRIEIVIDETGQVEGAVMTGSVTSAYDSLVLNATRTWRYKPATINGAPVKFKKTVQIAIRPTTL